MYGTNLFALGTLDSLLSAAGLGGAINSTVDSLCTACTQFLIGSSFNAQLDGWVLHALDPAAAAPRPASCSCPISSSAVT